MSGVILPVSTMAELELAIEEPPYVIEDTLMPQYVAKAPDVRVGV
jgi:hypothetical protein